MVAHGNSGQVKSAILSSLGQDFACVSLAQGPSRHSGEMRGSLLYDTTRYGLAAAQAGGGARVPSDFFVVLVKPYEFCSRATASKLDWVQQ